MRLWRKGTVSGRRVSAVPLLYMCAFSLLCHLGNSVADVDVREYDYSYYDQSKSDVMPSFVSRTQHVTAKSGDRVDLPCYVQNRGSHVLIIKRYPKSNGKEQLLAVGGVKLLQAPRFISEDSQLIISRVRPQDSGTYVCTFSTAPEVVLSHTLDVQFPPTISTAIPLHHVVPKGSSVRLYCDAEGNPKPKIIWTRYQGILPSDTALAEGEELNLMHVDIADEGQYICTADNGVGSPVSAAVSVVVEYKPEITTEQSVVRTGEGDEVELVCLVQGQPNPQVSWTRNGKPIHKAHNVQVTQHEGVYRHSLVVTPVTEEDFGPYVCIAENSQGEDSGVIQLTGLPRQPNMRSGPPTGAKDSFNFLFETVTYHPIIEYRLMYRRAQVNQSTTLPDKWHDVLIPVEEYEPSTRRRTHKQAASSRSKGTEHAFQFTMRGLEAGRDYEAVVRARNKYGWSSDSGLFPFSTRTVIPHHRSILGELFFSSSASPSLRNSSFGVVVIILTVYM